jgi:hypothetical protein
MDSHTDSEIVTEFLGYHRMALDSENILHRQGSLWAKDLIWDLAYKDPSRCWSLIRSIAVEQPNDDAMMSLSSVLGALLREHPKYIDVMGHDVLGNKQLTELMSWIEEDPNIDPSVWLQIEALSKLA